MRITMTTHITGSRNGEQWPEVGGVIDVPDHEAADLMSQSYAEPYSADDEPEAAGDVPDGNVATILDWVDGDPVRAQQALDAEQASTRPRASLAAALTGLLATEEEPDEGIEADDEPEAAGDDDAAPEADDDTSATGEQDA